MLNILKLNILKENNEELKTYKDGLSWRDRFWDAGKLGSWGMRETPAQAIKRIINDSKLNEITKTNKIDDELRRLDRIVTAEKGDPNYNILKASYPRINFFQYLKYSLEEEGIFNDETFDYLKRSSFLDVKYPSLTKGLKSGMNSSFPLNPPNDMTISEKEYNKVKDEVQSLNSKLDEKDSQRLQLDAENKRLINTNKELESKVKNFEKLNINLQHELTEKKNTLAEAHAKVKELENTIIALKSSNNSNSEQTNALLKDVTDQLTNARTKFKQKEQDYINTIKSNEEALKNAGIKFEELNAAYKEQSKKLENFENMTWYDYLKTGAGKGLEQMLSSMGEHPFYWAGGVAGTMLLGYGLYKAFKKWKEYRSNRLNKESINDDKNED